MDTTIEQDVMTVRYANARVTAARRSMEFGCTVHVNAFVSVLNGVPQITAYHVSDWYVGGSTVASFTDGRSAD